MGRAAASGVCVQVAVPGPAALTPHPQFLHVFSRLTNCQGGTAAIPAILGPILLSRFLRRLLRVSSPPFLHLAPKNVLISKCFLWTVAECYVPTFLSLCVPFLCNSFCHECVRRALCSLLAFPILFAFSLKTFCSFCGVLACSVERSSFMIAVYIRRCLGHSSS